MVYNGKSQSKMDLKVPPFQEPPYNVCVYSILQCLHVTVFLLNGKRNFGNHLNLWHVIVKRCRDMEHPNLVDEIHIHSVSAAQAWSVLGPISM